MAGTLTPNSVILLATNNQKKLKEMQGQFEGTGVSVLTLKDMDMPQAEETGSNTAENAAIKSTGAAQNVDLAAISAKVGKPVDKVIVVAEDTGFEIPSLGGWPAHKYADLVDETGSDAAANQAILTKLEGKEGEDRKAIFTSTLAVTEVTSAGISGKPELFTAAAEGTVSKKPFGENGFGFDPIFGVEDSRGRVVGFAQIDAIRKSELSPRPRAVDQMVAAVYPKTDAAPAGPEQTRKMGNGQ